MVIRERRHAFDEPRIHCGIPLAQNAGVMRISRHAAQPEQQCRPERCQILVTVKQNFRRDSLTASQLHAQRPHPVCERGNRRRVEIDVCDCGKQTVYDQVGFSRTTSILTQQRTGKADHLTGQHILLKCSIGLFSAHTGRLAPGPFCRLLALVTKHCAHLYSSLVIYFRHHYIMQRNKNPWSKPRK
jgi:hypothetical protein